ncbi:MAG: hypothetical protein IKW37_03510 [Bacteroidaceae bacterium]|nr:hypothetical protein [Bacteroidaceae bacterium]
MDRYSLIHTKMPREFVLLQGMGCKWKKCTFCDYHEDVSENPYEVNESVLRQVTGEYGVLDIINSGSAMELDDKTIALIKEVVKEKQIHTLWFEAHYMYRKKLASFAEQFVPVKVKFRCGVETFDVELRDRWKKGIPSSVTPEDVAQYFQGVCLLCCTEGESKEHIMNDIEIAMKHFEYFSVNVFCNNSTPVKQDPDLAQWFAREIYPQIKDVDGIEVLMENTDLGVG